jgi:hypothetical protein
VCVGGGWGVKGFHVNGNRRPAHLDRDGLKLGDNVAEDGQLEAEEDEDADAVGDPGVAGDGEAVEGELGHGQVGSRLGEGVEAGAEQEEEGVDGNAGRDPPGAAEGGPWSLFCEMDSVLVVARPDHIPAGGISLVGDSGNRIT